MTCHFNRYTLQLDLLFPLQLLSQFTATKSYFKVMPKSGTIELWLIHVWMQWLARIASTYLLQALRAHRCSYGRFWEIGRWRIWAAVDWNDNTETQLLKQVLLPDTDRTECSSIRLAVRRLDYRSSNQQWSCQIGILRTIVKVISRYHVCVENN